VAKPSLSAEAQKALAQAEADVQAARAGFTLWVPAENALGATQEAAKAGDSETVLKLGKSIAELTRLGAGQAKYPSTEAIPEPAAPSATIAPVTPLPAAPVPTPAPSPAPVPAALPVPAPVPAVPPSAAPATVQAGASPATAMTTAAALLAVVPAAPQPVAKPPLSAEAQKALAQAEADVQAARAGFTLWVPAENALGAAQEAAKAGDSETVLKLSKGIAELTRLGAGQAKYASTEAPPPEALVVTPLPPALSAEAQKALAQAEVDVQAARAGFTLWVPAENALGAAQEAAKAGDSETVLKLAKGIAELTRLGAEQAKYPSTETPVKAAAKKAAKPKAKAKQKPAASKSPAPKAASKTPAAKTASKPVATAATSRAPSPAPAAAPLVPASPKAAAEGGRPKPRKLCWQGDRLDVCPEK
jgi:hypothetical protein